MSKMNINDLAITSLETINAFDVLTGGYLFTLDELQSASIAQAQEKSDITGKQGRKLNSLKKNKSVTISGNNGLISGGLMGLQVGGAFENKNTEVKWSEYLEISGDSATICFKAIGTTGNEIKRVYVKNPDGTIKEVLTQDATAAAGKFAYAPTTKKLTFLAGAYEDGTEIVVHYDRKISGDVLANNSDSYSKKATLYIDALAEDKCSNVYRVQIYIPKADFSGEFTFDMGGDQTVHAFSAEALAGACGLGGALWTYTVFGANAEDVE